MGIAGVAYDGVQVMPVPVLGADGTGQDSDIIEGVVWAADHGADVILMAFSNPGYWPVLQDAIDYAWSQGAVLVAATGNDASSTSLSRRRREVVGVGHRADDALAGCSTTARPPSWRPLASIGRLAGRRRPNHRHLGLRRHVAGCRGPPARAGSRLPTAPSSAAWPATPTRPAPRPRPATAA